LKREFEKSGIPIQLNNNCVIASIQVELNERLIVLFREELLKYIQHVEAKGVILDLSGIELIDYQDFNGMRSIISMIKLMGFETVISGLKPGVVASLIMLNVSMDGIRAAADLDDAFNYFSSTK
jgi:rsbT antagonist protein RsbS